MDEQNTPLDGRERAVIRKALRESACRHMQAALDEQDTRTSLYRVERAAEEMRLYGRI